MYVRCKYLLQPRTRPEVVDDGAGAAHAARAQRWRGAGATSRVVDQPLVVREDLVRRHVQTELKRHQYRKLELHQVLSVHSECCLDAL